MRICPLIFLGCVLGLATGVSAATGAPLLVSSATGPVTSAEISAFKNYMDGETPPNDGSGNVWVFGHPGKALEALCLMVEVSHDPQILNRAIVFADAALAGRNDLLSAADGGQRRAWTGKIEPIWPSSAPGVEPAGAGIEQGDVLSHIAFCAKLILQMPALADQLVPDHDPHHFGKTYHQRALTYLAQCDHVIDAWILPHFIRAAEHNHYYFPAGANTYKASEPAPWNQAWMLTNALVRLAECHALLKDAPKRVALYDAIAAPNIDWFLANQRRNISRAGTRCCIWAYSLSAPEGVEDTNHAAYDTEGLWIAYHSGRYLLTAAQLLPFANTYVDVVMATQKDGRFAGRVDGSTGTNHAGGDDFVRDEYLYLAEFRPDAFPAMAKAELAGNHAASSPPITARLLWEIDRRSKHLSPQTAASHPEK
jgi:hypothetical protein